jgi:hypothetical protein
VAWLPLDPGVAGGGDWFRGSDPWEAREDQLERRDFSLWLRASSFLFAVEKDFGRGKRNSKFGTRGERKGVVICLLISRTSPFSYDDCCLYPSSFFVVYILVS